MQLRLKLNAAYEEETVETFEALLSLLEVMLSLSPTPRFLVDLNEAGAVPVTTCLEQLLVRLHMLKLPVCLALRRCASSLMEKFQIAIPKLKINEIREMRSDRKASLEIWSNELVLACFAKGMKRLANSNDVSAAGILVVCFRILLIHAQQTGSK